MNNNKKKKKERLKRTVDYLVLGFERPVDPARSPEDNEANKSLSGP